MQTWSRVGALIDAPLVYPELTVRENLRINCMLRGADPSRIDHTLLTWNLQKIADRKYRQLSLGNRQRLGLAAALHHNPDVIVLDEPSNALDPASVIGLRDQLTRRAQNGAAVLVSSHHLDEVARIANRALLINASRLIGQLDTAGTDLERVFFERIRADDHQRQVINTSKESTP